MRKEILQKLEVISEEEQEYLKGQKEVQKNIYTKKEFFEVDWSLLSIEEHPITVRTHTRFVEFPEHKHNYIEMMYVCQGSITHYINDNEIVMTQGDILLLNQHVKHRIKKAGKTDIAINFIALPEFFDIPLAMVNKGNALAEFLINSLRQNNLIAHYLLFHLKGNLAVDNLMENMIISMLNNSENEEYINKYSMGVVFLYLLNNMETLSDNSSENYKDMMIQFILKFIDVNFKNATLTKLADDFHQSLSSLSKMIKQSTGYTFQELLQRKRYQKAIMLLLETNLSVKEISVAVGYENLSYFYRQFRKHYQVTPKQYRQLHKNDKRIRI